MKDKGGYFYRMMRNNIALLNGKIWRVQVLYLANEPFKPNWCFFNKASQAWLLRQPTGYLQFNTFKFGDLQSIN